MKRTAFGQVFVQSKRVGGIRPALLRQAVEHVLARVAPQIAGEVTVALVSDTAMRRLNRRFRGRDQTTDVLAFPLSDGETPGLPFGDIVISYETARRQAREYGVRLHAELLRLLVHGTLHLCGYDHYEPKEAARMHRLTRALLHELDDAA